MQHDRKITNRFIRRVFGAAAVVLGAACAGAPANESAPSDAMGSMEAPMSGAGPELEGEVARIRTATEQFASLDEAVAAGYARDAGGCLENPPHGGMGFHHQNASLLDDQLELERPEILVYERLPNGDYRFNGVEYIVPFTSRATDEEPPTIMGQQLKPAPSLGIWYLHVWVWHENPTGLFADWNPRVNC